MKKTNADGRLPPEEVLAFMPGSEEFGIDLQRVQEIRGLAAFAQDVNDLDLDQRNRISAHAYPYVK